MVTVEKYHGTGNDFVVVDASEDVPHRRTFANDCCDRDDGITHPDSDDTGADGVLFLAMEPDYRPPRVVMTLVQPDGSVAAMCGNGARCAATWAARQTGANEVMIDTPSGTRHAAVADDAVTVEMGTPRFDPDHVPLARDDPLVEEQVGAGPGALTVTAVDTGVPHAVAFVENVDDVDLEAVGPPIRDADVYPVGTNVTLASPADDGDGFRQRTFERGVEAETDSCGTGAVAVAAVAHRLDRVDASDPVRVAPPGGDLHVTATPDGATLRGPVVREFRADVEAATPTWSD
jgi:diaminopimelate epimerase